MPRCTVLPGSDYISDGNVETIVGC